MDVSFDGEIWFWRGPSPWHFVMVPGPTSEALAANAARISYGWGMIPVTARIGTTQWRTSMFSKDGHYVVPIRASVRTAEDVELGDAVTVHLHVDV